jgi:hypothetical protein
MTESFRAYNGDDETTVSSCSTIVQTVMFTTVIHAVVTIVSHYI